VKQEKTTLINGQHYDSVTGLPVAEPKIKQPVSKAQELHGTATRSKTLRRSSVKKSTPSAATATAARPKPSLSADITPRKRPSTPAAKVARPEAIKKFTTSATAPNASKDIAARTHPHALKAQQRRTQAKKAPVVAKPTVPTSREIKEAEIAKAIAATPKPAKRQKRTERQRHAKLVRIATIVTIAMAIIVAAVWINLPTLSVKIASMQSGITARFPHFRPDGYTLKLPVVANDNKVTMTFDSNQNASAFTLTQEKSSWDSQAVRASVEKQSKGQFLTTNDRGLTVYTFNGNAAWVNAGTLYTISGGSHLSNDTILRIANSL
jgi:hypothetical protein